MPASKQHAAYPDIEPDDTTVTPQDAYAAAMKVITKRKWRVVDSRPPQGPLPRVIDARASQAATVRDGIIEADATILPHFANPADGFFGKDRFSAHTAPHRVL